MTQPPVDPALKDKYLASAPGCSSMSEHARKEGVSRTTFRGRLVIFGIEEEVRALYNDPTHREYADVTTRDGRNQANRELEIKDLKKRTKDLEARLLDQENLIERITIASTDPLPKPKFRVKANRSKKPSRTILLPIFDAQYGQRVRREDTIGGVGGFDSEVFASRLKTYVEKVSALMVNYAGGHSIEGLVFALGGDMVEGDEIFSGQEWQLELNPAEQVMGIRDHLAYAIDALMGVGASLGVKQASVLAVPGNHGTIGGRKKGARPKSYNWDMIVYKLLEERLANHPIKNFVIEGAGNCIFDIAGNLFGMVHGDEVKGWGGLPFYGLTRQDARNIRTLNVIPQYVLLGHHHQPASIPIGYGEYLMSGNWVGANNLSGVVGSNTPSQWCFGVSPEHGVCDRFLLYLDDVRKPTPTIHQTA